MGSLVDLMVRLEDESDPDIGMVDHVDDNRWIIGGQDIFPVQIEMLQGGTSFLLYGTALRETAEPVFLPLMISMFIEGLNGHSLGNYGICPGPVTLSLYQKITIPPRYSLEKLKAQIACQRLLIECFLDAGYDRHEDLTLITGEGQIDTPILPFRH